MEKRDSFLFEFNSFPGLVARQIITRKPHFTTVKLTSCPATRWEPVWQSSIKTRTRSMPPNVWDHRNLNCVPQIISTHNPVWKLTLSRSPRFTPNAVCSPVSSLSTPSVKLWHERVPHSTVLCEQMSFVIGGHISKIRLARPILFSGHRALLQCCEMGQRGLLLGLGV